MTLALAPQGLPDGVHALHEPFAALALGAKADLAVDDQRAQRSFRRVVRRLDPLLVQEGPHRGLQLQNPATLPRGLVSLAARALIEQPDHSLSDRFSPSAGSLHRDLSTLVLMPDSEERRHQQGQSLTNPAVLLFSFGHPLEVAGEVGKAHQPLVRVHKAVRGEPVRDNDARGLLTEQLLRDVSLTRVPEQEDGGVCADADPAPPELALGAPSRLIEVFRGRCRHRRQGSGVRVRKTRGHSPLHVRDGTEGDLDAVGVGNEPLDLASGHAVLSREHHHQGGEIGTEGALVRSFGQLCSALDVVPQAEHSSRWS